MNKRAARTLTILYLIASLAPSVSPAAAQSDTRKFDQTGYSVSGRFLDYFDSHGGLDWQGPPLSSPSTQNSLVNEQPYQIQYFEQTAFEYHPENKPPYDVLLSPLGTLRYDDMYPHGPSVEKASDAPDAVRFRETGKTLGGDFLEYWRTHGDIAQLGYPISNEFPEKSDADGKTYIMQYFERAVLQYRPSSAQRVVALNLGHLRYHLRQREISRVLGAMEQVLKWIREDYAYPDFRGHDLDQMHDEYDAKIRVASGLDAGYRLVGKMVRDLGDDHSRFTRDPRTPSEMARAAVVGIGAWIETIDGVPRFALLAPRGSAAANGIKLYDAVLKINGQPVKNEDEVADLLFGRAGTILSMTVQTPNEQPRDVLLAREYSYVDDYPSGEFLPGTHIALITIPTFDFDGVSAAIGWSIQDLADKAPLDGVILDLRINQGGLVAEEMDATSLFVDGGLAGYRVYRTGRDKIQIDEGYTLDELKNVPVVGLIGGTCASACEHFSAALKLFKRAQFVGVNSAGNTETVYTHTWIDNAALHLAEATFELPDGSSIEGSGVAPDVRLDVPWYSYSRADDPQIKAAVELIKKQR